MLAVATEWDPHHGGLSSLNRNLCVALARAGHRVACLVPTVFREEVAAASKLGVELVEATPAKGKDVGPLACLQRKPALPKDFAPDIIIGHGRVTGSAAQTLVDDFFPQALRIHLLHTVPGEIEWYKPRSTDAALRAEGDEQAETELGRTAALAVGVGPRLAMELENLLAPFDLPRPVHQMDPGLDRTANVLIERPTPRMPPRGMHCLFLGRAEDQNLKGLDIAADAMALVRTRGKQAVLVVRGAQSGTGQKLQEQLIARVRAPNSVRVKEFSADSQRIQEDLLRSTIVLMPSRTEGFGLVGLEAIECGIPTLLSDQSGLAQLLRCRDLPEEVGRRVVVPVTTDPEATAEEWARRIDAELHDPAAAFRRAAEVRTAVAKVFTWDRTAAALVAAINVQPKSGSGMLSDPIASSAPPYPDPSNAATVTPQHIGQVLGKQTSGHDVPQIRTPTQAVDADAVQGTVNQAADENAESDKNIPGDFGTIGKRVCYVMYVRDIRPSALDRVLEKEQGYTSRLLKTGRHPNADVMARLSQALGVPVCFLVDGQSNLFLSRDLRAVAIAVRRLRHKVRAPLGDVLARSLFDFPFIQSSLYPIEQELRGLAPLDVFSMGTLSLLVAANPPTPEQDYKAIKAAFTITAKAIESTGMSHDQLTPELGSAWLEAMPIALGTDKSLPVQEITSETLLLSAKRYEEDTGTPPPLRIYPTWWMAAQNAKRHLPSVPPEYIDMVGDLTIHLDRDPDWRLVVDLARGLYNDAIRSGDDGV
ncbi:glycosyltransferase family 4 protein [Sorangium sp. So ce118]